MQSQSGSSEGLRGGGGVDVPLFPLKIILQLFPCSSKKKLSCSSKFTFTEFPVPRNAAPCSLIPKNIPHCSPHFPSYFIFLWLVIFIGFTSLIIVQVLLGKRPLSPP